MSFVRIVNHLVFSTKNREPWLKEEIQSSMFAYMGGIVRERKGTLMKAGGMADHVHLLVAMHQTTTVADLVRDIKSGSSRWMHDQDAKFRGFAWQTKYGAFSVSNSMEETVQTYIGIRKSIIGNEHSRMNSGKCWTAMVSRMTNVICGNKQRGNVRPAPHPGRTY
jgi:REP element-mobilizing transposase RayT